MGKATEACIILTIPNPLPWTSETNQRIPPKQQSRCLVARAARIRSPLLGKHPTQHKLCSAHVRPFSKSDFLAFLNDCFPGGYELADFRGAQFYPFPGKIARPLAYPFPSLAFTIFFLIRKMKEYHDEFATYPSRARLETNFWSGDVLTESQYWKGGQ